MMASRSVVREQVAAARQELPVATLSGQRPEMVPGGAEAHRRTLGRLGSGLSVFSREPSRLQVDLPQGATKAAARPECVAWPIVRQCDREKVDYRPASPDKQSPSCIGR